MTLPTRATRAAAPQAASRAWRWARAAASGCTAHGRAPRAAAGCRWTLGRRWRWGAWSMR
eukprot:238939-Prymnesium_polylepis.1